MHRWVVVVVEEVAPQPSGGARASTSDHRKARGAIESTSCRTRTGRTTRNMLQPRAKWSADVGGGRACLKCSRNRGLRCPLVTALRLVASCVAAARSHTISSLVFPYSRTVTVTAWLPQAHPMAT